MSSKIQQLRDNLFNQMEALKNCNPEELENEIKRSKAMTGVADVIVETAKVEVEFFKTLPTSSKHETTPTFLKLETIKE